MPSRSSKRPRDANQLAKLIVDLATGEIVENRAEVDSGKNPAAVALGKLGGRKGGRARADKLSAEERRAIAQRAALARWRKPWNRNAPMTAEIVVANKVAVAFAADSTVTIRGGGADKTYNTANKLFTISKLYPVGALIYGSTNINRIPLEVIIKEFRLTLPDQEKPTLKEYADEFLEFLRNSVQGSCTKFR
jgi:hypothetical protein